MEGKKKDYISRPKAGRSRTSVKSEMDSRSHHPGDSPLHGTVVSEGLLHYKIQKKFLNGNNAETDKYFNNAVSGTKTLNI